ncbi:MAG: hypothetical protein GY758_35185 [Fuerstiella sp.]|jgi:hypothetical protein|nr:hypothetical protein [Fuerstiella sp.]MCP4507200.1 hypothetical protein [Fuerstiella sp.]MDG2126880.1 hypothetical protein [Fuerstiella sp.]
MFAAVRETKAAFMLLPLSVTGAALPAPVTVPFELVGGMFQNRETPATDSGNVVTPLRIFVGFVAWAVMGLIQLIP